jgi:hypothetical protein
MGGKAFFGKWEWWLRDRGTIPDVIIFCEWLGLFYLTSDKRRRTGVLGSRVLGYSQCTMSMYV